MEKTLFAGLTVLDEDEPLNAGGGTFTGSDRLTIDRALELGVLTHRHDARDPLDNPTAPFLGASAVASGGTIDAGEAFGVGYTLEDDQSGETLLGPTITLSTQSPLDPPLATPVASASYDTGSLPVDTYYYAISHVDGEGGETAVGPAVGAEREPGYANAHITLTGLSGELAAASAAGWRLYRAVGGGDLNYLASGAVDSYDDDGSASANCDFTPLADDQNTTNGNSSLLIALPSAGAPVSDSSFINLYISPDGTFVGDSLIEQYPVASAGQTVLLREVNLLEGEPPDVNTAWGGASKIDPDTEILDWHWKRPVAGEYALGSGELGDVRLNTGNGVQYAMLQASGSGAADWTKLGSAGGGGGGGGMGASALLDVTDSDGPVLVDIDKLEFYGSGDTGVAISDLGGGSARVTISGPIAPPAGMGASALLDVSDSDGPDIPDIGHLTFAASGSATVGVSDLGNGSAQVMISASAAPGAQGPPGADGDDGADGAQGPAGTGNSSVTALGEGGLYAGASAIAFGASGALSVHAEDLGGGSAKVLHAPHGRRWGSASVASIPASGSAAVAFDGGAAGVRILALNTDRQARVRAYTDGEASAADQARALGTDPTGDHGVLLDFRTTTDDLAWKLTPVVDAHNMQDPVENATTLILTNLDGTTEDVTVAFLYIPTEVV